MADRFGRRRFIIVGGSGLAGTMLLKACTSNTASSSASPTMAESPSTAPIAASRNTIEVGILHSLSGTMSISEKSVVDAEQLAISEINANRSNKYPFMSVSVAEEEVKAIGVKYLKGHYASWNYFQTVNTSANKTFVDSFEKKDGTDRVVNDPMEAAYIMVYMWKMAVEKAKTTELEAVGKAALGLTFDAPAGKVTPENNHHLSKLVRIGEIDADGMFEIVSESKEAVKPIPWNKYIAETKGYACDWSDPAKGGKYKS